MIYEIIDVKKIETAQNHVLRYLNYKVHFIIQSLYYTISILFISYLVSISVFSCLLPLELEATTFSIIQREFSKKCEAAAVHSGRRTTRRTMRRRRSIETTYHKQLILTARE